MRSYTKRRQCFTGCNVTVEAEAELDLESAHHGLVWGFEAHTSHEKGD